jgi:hypothetical protein
VAFPTRKERIAAAEEQLGAQLPPEYRNRLASHNSGDLMTAGDKWRVFPVLDTTDARTSARTANHLVVKAQQASGRSGFPAGAVAIAENGSGDLLVFRPGPIKGTLGGRLERWDHVTGQCTPTALDYSGSQVAAMDAPKSLRDPQVRQARVEAIEQPHVARLTGFVRELQAEMGPEYSIPYFDPADGGTNATVLYLLEAPGAGATKSGFVSRDNPDETAKNFFLLNREAGIDRGKTVIWNVVPWYIGNGKGIRAAKARDPTAGANSLARLFGLLPKLQCVVFLGAHAAQAAPIVATLRPGLPTFEVPHPSPVFVNRAPGNRERILSVLRIVAA